MEKLYIKFEEGNKESLDSAVKEAKKLGYEQWDNDIAMEGEGFGLLHLDEDGTYYTSDSVEDLLIEDGYIEHIIQDQFEVGEIVELYFKVEDRYIEYKYVGKLKNNILLTSKTNNLDDYGIYIISVEGDRVRKLQKTIKITTEDGQTLEISKEKAIDLGFKVN